MTTYVHERAVLEQIRTPKCRPLDGVCQKCQGAGCFETHGILPNQDGRRCKPRRDVASLFDITFNTLRERHRDQIVQRALPQDRDLALVIEMARYYNQHMVPSTTPNQRPFKRNLIPLEHWPVLPLALRHTWIVMVKTRQAFQAAIDPLLHTGLCYYRGRSLTLLQKMLSQYEEAVDDPWAATLMSVLFVMGADMQLCEEHWTVHLEAARKLISDRGGLQTCLQLPSVGPLLAYMNADIMTSTTCQPWAINPRALKSQFEYLTILPNVGTHLLEHGHACPTDILTVITYTNILRVASHRPLTEDEMVSLPDDATFERAWVLLDEFDCEAWALKISLIGRILPQRTEDELAASGVECLTSLARSYRAAATLYLLLSVNKELAIAAAIHEEQTVLSRSLAEVFHKASIDHDDPLHGQLWKFTVWPLFVSAYLKAGWDIGADSLELAIDRFAGVGMVLSSTRLLKVPKFLLEIQERRSMQFHRQWQWDDGFGSRLAYVL